MTPPEIYRAFANVTRLRILSLLHEQKDICVCDLCAILGEPQPKVSRHLAILRDAGLVEVRSEEKWKFYGLAQPRLPLQRALLRTLQTAFGAMPELNRDRERLDAIELRARCT